MNCFDFREEISICAQYDIEWEKIDNKTIMITGATGLIGKYLIEVLMKRNSIFNLNTKVIAVGRSREKFEKRLYDESYGDNLVFYNYDVQYPCDYEGNLDFILHMASNTHPRLYASEPVNTEMSNILGTYHLLKKAAENKKCRFVFTSSGDIYGDNRSAKEFLSEEDCGYIDCNTLRAGYIEGKRASEALCNAFLEEKGVDFVTARLCRIYGPTMQESDSKAISQFINNAVKGENIVLKSTGSQVFSYLYIFDVVSAILTIMARGKTGGAYNVADNNQTSSLKDLALLLANVGSSKVVFHMPDDVESKGASSFQNVKLDGSKLCCLGWKSCVPMEEGLSWTVHQLRSDPLGVRHQKL